MSTAESRSSQVVEPQPALAHPATHEQQWHVKHLWGLVYLAACAPLAILVVAVLGKLPASALPLACGIGVVIALPFLALAWYLDPAVRQRRYLRKYPWVAFPAKVTRLGRNTSLGNALVRFTDEHGRQWAYLVTPNDADFAEGERPIWFAGEPGRTAGVISLREGACTGMAYRSGLA